MLENAKAIEAWNTVLFDKFVRFRRIIVDGLGLHGKLALARHPPPPAARVADLGCGFGDTTIELARRVGERGEAVGIDCAPHFIECAIADARAAHVSNAHFLVRDVQGEDLEGPYDYAYSRFGTLFFEQPVAAMRNVRRALAHDATFVSVVWRRKDDNEFMFRAEECVKAIVPPLPESTLPTCGPGPFSMASADVATDVFLAAGFRDVTLERSDQKIFIGKDLDDAIAFALALGPAGEHIRLSGEEATKRMGEILPALREVLAPMLSNEGVLGNSSAWIVTAKA